ncbi:hypothetical protein evm_005809 [Chilo suppressalis]|nr:hypothetical protein evm_005809 [Chilo suppressalis]
MQAGRVRMVGVAGRTVLPAIFTSGLHHHLTSGGVELFVGPIYKKIPLWLIHLVASPNTSANGIRIYFAKPISNLSTKWQQLFFELRYLYSVGARDGPFGCHRSPALEDRSSSKNAERENIYFGPDNTYYK